MAFYLDNNNLKGGCGMTEVKYCKGIVDSMIERKKDNNVSEKKKQLLNASEWGILVVFVCTILGWSFYQAMFGDSICVPFNGGIEVNGWKAFAIYIGVALLLYFLARIFKTDSKIFTVWGIGYGAFVVSIYSKFGVHKLSIYIFMSVLIMYLLYGYNRVKNMNAGADNREAWVLLLKCVSSAFFHVLGIVYTVMVICTACNSYTKDIEFNLIEMVCKETEYTAKDKTWEEMMHVETIRNNMDLISMFSYENWTKLSDKQKETLLNEIVIVESEILGIENAPVVNIYIRPKDSCVAGYYLYKDNSIWIGSDQISSPQNALECLFHELRHCYQNNLAEIEIDDIPEKYRNLEVFRNIQNYKFEFSNYKSVEDSGCSKIQYRHQACEADSREYAAITSLYYYELANANSEEDIERILESGRIK